MVLNILQTKYAWIVHFFFEIMTCNNCWVFSYTPHHKIIKVFIAENSLLLVTNYTASAEPYSICHRNSYMSLYSPLHDRDIYSDFFRYTFTLCHKKSMKKASRVLVTRGNYLYLNTTFWKWDCYIFKNLVEWSMCLWGWILGQMQYGSVDTV